LPLPEGDLDGGSPRSPAAANYYFARLFAAFSGFKRCWCPPSASPREGLPTTRYDAFAELSHDGLEAHEERAEALDLIMRRRSLLDNTLAP